MLPESCQWILEEFEPEGDRLLLLAIAKDLEDAGNLEGAASVYDRAYGIDPELEPVREGRARVLDALAVTEHGLTFRYVPVGPFLMGSRDGEPDEQPLRPVWLEAYWIAETPLSWAAYCALMGWHPPSNGMPRDLDTSTESARSAAFRLRELNKIRMQYCEDLTTRAVGWHAHVPPAADWVQFSGSPRQLAPRSDAGAPYGYTAKPLVAVSWQEAEELTARLSSTQARYTLPTEAQWEKAARGGLIGARYPWGDEPPTPERCDFDRFHEFAVGPMKALPPNGYGLYAMAGGVWEWTRDWYDREWYRQAPDREPGGPAKGEQRALRGGSWADCADVCTVTFRMSAESESWRAGPRWGCPVPTIGFRLCRVAAAQRTSSA
jgi:sulfatase modifying factor 1